MFVRYWNVDKVELRYFILYFLGYVDVEVVYDKFELVFGDFGYEKFV